jgi:hypothetical protein
LGTSAKRYQDRIAEIEDLSRGRRRLFEGRRERAGEERDKVAT